MLSRNTDPALLPAHVMSDEIGAGRLSPVDIVDAALARIGAQDPKAARFCRVYDKEARLGRRCGGEGDPLRASDRAVARHSDCPQRPDRDRGAGHDRRVAGVARAALGLYSDVWRRSSSPPVLIVIGKTHTVEFAMGGWGDQPAPRHAVEPVGPRGRAHPRRGRAAALGWRSPPGLRRGLSAPTPAARCGAGVVVRPDRAQDDRSAGSAPTAYCRSPRPSTHRGRLPARSTDAALLYNVMQGPDPLRSAHPGRHARRPDAGNWARRARICGSPACPMPRGPGVARGRARRL